MFFRNILPVILLSSISSLTSAAPVLEKRNDPSTAGNATLIAALDLAPTGRARHALFHKDTDFIFDFINPPIRAAVASGNAGTVTNANRNSFPALIGSGGSMSFGQLGECHPPSMTPLYLRHHHHQGFLTD